MFKNTRYRLNWKNHALSVDVLLIFGGLLFAILTFTGICGRRLAPYFSLQYHSIGNLLSFFLILGLLKLPMGALVAAIPKTASQLDSLSPRKVKCLRILCSTLSTTVVMVLVDYFMDSVHIPDLAVLAIAFFLAVLDLRLNSGEEE